MTDDDGSSDGEATGSSRTRDIVVVTTVTVIAVVLLYARAPFAAEQFWAEDGREFYGEAVRLGPLQSMGESAAGYYLTVSRIGGVLASLVPIRAAALTMWLWVAAVNAWLVATVMVSSRTWLTTWPARIVVALSMVLLPVLGFESIANAANLQFVMVFACVVVLIGKPRSRIEAANGTVLLAATGLTTPVAVFLVPFAVLRMVRRRSWMPDSLVVGWLAGVALQLAALVATRPTGPDREGDSASVVLDRLELAGFRFNLLPNDLQRFDGWFVMAAYALVLAAVIVLAWRQRQRERAVVLALVPLFGVGALVLLGVISSAANRYMVLTGLCLVWGAAAGAETIGAALPTSWRLSPAIVSGAVAAVLLVAFVARWTPSEVRRSGSTWSESLDAGEEYCADNPGGSATLRFAPVRPEKPDQWSIRLSCREL